MGIAIAGHHRSLVPEKKDNQAWKLKIAKVSDLTLLRSRKRLTWLSGDMCGGGWPLESSDSVTPVDCSIAQARMSASPPLLCPKCNAQFKVLDDLQIHVMDCLDDDYSSHADETAEPKTKSASHAATGQLASEYRNEWKTRSLLLFVTAPVLREVRG